MSATRVPWQVKWIGLVLIWGSSFLLMKVGLESLSAVQIAALRLATGAVTILVLLWMRGGSLPRERWVWGHLVVTGLLLGTLPFTLFALSETRVSSALAGIVAVGVLLALIGVVVHTVGVHWVDRFLPPVLAGTIVALIGFNLAGAARGNYEQAPITATWRVCTFSPAGSMAVRI